MVAKGVRAPDLSRDKALKLEGRRVKVPVGPPVPAQQYAHSSFLQVSDVVRAADRVLGARQAACGPFGAAKDLHP